MYFTEGCLSKVGFLVIIFLGAYIIFYVLGMGIVLWIINLEIYLLRYRGVGGGIVVVLNWIVNFIVSEIFLILIYVLGFAGIFFLFAGFLIIGFIFIYLLVFEIKGLFIEEVERMFENGFKFFFFKVNKDSKEIISSKV